jgi:hypothetical protein
MPINVKKAREKQVIAVEASAPSYKPRRATPVEAGDIDAIFEGLTSIDPTAEPPDIEMSSIDIQGEKGSAKSTLAVGNERAIHAALTDGSPIFSRSLSKIVSVRSPDDFGRLVDNTLNYAAKHGTSGQYCTFTVDPTVVLVQWLLRRELEKANNDALKQFEIDQRFNRIASDQVYQPWESIRDVPQANMTQFPKVAEMILQIGDRFRTFGWGFWTCTHYKWGVQYDEKGRPKANWIPDIPGSSAHILAKYSDMLVVANKELVRRGDSAYPMYSARFQQDGGESVGSRVPIVGDAVFLDYKDKRTPKNYVSLHTLRDKYNAARSEWVAQQQEFSIASQG